MADSHGSSPEQDNSPEPSDNAETDDNSDPSDDPESSERSDDGYDLWLESENEAWRNLLDGSEVDEDDIDDFDVNAARANWDTLDEDTAAELYNRILDWREAEEELADEIEDDEYLETWYQKWQGGPEDDDQTGDKDDERPPLEAYMKFYDDLVVQNLPWPSEGLLKKIITFTSFCPSRNVRTYLELSFKRLENRLDIIFTKIPEVKENLDEHLSDINTRLRDREDEERQEDALEKPSMSDEERIEAGLLDPRLGWVGGWWLGSGGQTKHDEVTVSFKQDSKGNIIDRMVIKDMEFDRPNPLYWANGEINSIPLEIKALCEMRGLVGSNTIIKIRNWRPWQEEEEEEGQQGYRQYLEYCPFGDLRRLIDNIKYASAAGRVRQRFPDNRDQLAVGEPFIPEPFIWYCMDNLTIAGLLMERGELEPHGLKRWTVLLHRDIKPVNIFLANPSIRQFKGYPEPKLGDWGLVNALLPQLQTRPRLIDGWGTRSFKPVELQRNDMIPETRSNVWGIGMVAWSLIMATDKPNDPARPVDDAAKWFYSEDLTNLVTAMIQTNVNDRPYLDDIRKITHRNIHLPQPRHNTEHLRELNGDHPDWSNEATGLPEKYWVDPYRLGLALRSTDKARGGEVRIPSRPDEENAAKEDDLGGPTGTEFTKKRKRSREHEPVERGSLATIPTSAVYGLG